MGAELWRSDGTSAGTVMFDVYPGTSGSGSGNFISFNNTLYFTANDGTHGNELWKAVGYNSPSSGFAATNEDTAIVFSGTRQISISDVDALSTDTMQVSLTATHGTVHPRQSGPGELQLYERLGRFAGRRRHVRRYNDFPGDQDQHKLCPE